MGADYIMPTVPEILLIVLKNTYRDGIFTKTVPIPTTSDAEAIIGAIHKEDFFKLLFQMKNLGGNELTFSFYGAAEDDLSHGTDTPYSPPPDFPGPEWFPLPQGSGDVDAVDSDARIVTDNWTWVLITSKSANTGQPTTGEIHVRGV